jgi:UDP-N-acetylglucosamine pyrophosphorylase
MHFRAEVSDNKGFLFRTERGLGEVNFWKPNGHAQLSKLLKNSGTSSYFSNRLTRRSSST